MLHLLFITWGFFYHDKYVVVLADKASNNINFKYKRYNLQCFTKELGIHSKTENLKYTPAHFP